VTVCVVAYNHEKYIGQAVKSVLNQEVDFGVEVLVGDDGSDDRTVEKVRAMSAKAPFRLRLLTTRKKRSRKNRERIGGRANWMRLLEAARGKFVLTLDGDDYWMDRRKLKKQLWEFDQDNEVVLVCHDTEVIDEKGKVLRRKPGWKSRRELKLERVIEGMPVHISSVMVKKEVVKKLPGWFKRVAYGDWPYVMLYLAGGKGLYLAEVMTRYRIHAGGRWSLGGKKKRGEHLEEVKKNNIEILDGMKKMLRSEESELIDARVARWYMEMAKDRGVTGENLRLAREYWKLSMKRKWWNGDYGVPGRWGGFWAAYFPTLYKEIKMLMARKNGNRK